MLCTLLMLSGCVALEPDFENSEDATMEMGDIGFDEDEFLEEEEEIDFFVDLEDDTDDDMDSSEQEDLTDKKKESSAKKLDGFYYNQLDDEGKEIYLSLWEGFKDHADTIELKAYDANTVADIFSGVLRDHPEIYWVDWFQGVSYRSEEGRYDVTPSYFYGKNECEDIDRQIKEVRDEFMMGAGSKITDYEKIKYTFEFLVGSVEYGGEPRLCQNIETPFVHKQTVCGGYAKATKYLLDLLDVECIYVIGNASNSSGATESHAWNIVKCDGEYCLVDSTWGDPTSQDGSKPQGMENINYDYLCCNDEFLSKSHTPDVKYDYPDCTTNKWNYFILNDMYYEEFNTQEFIEHIRRDINNGKEISYFRFKNQSDYQQFVGVLSNNVFIEWGGELAEEKERFNGITYTYGYDDRNYGCTVYWKY